MENWKDVPNLFCNGKFQVKYEHGQWGTEWNKEKIFDFTPYRLDTMIRGFVKGNEVTLIARRVDSLTDEEIKKLEVFSFHSGSIESFRQVHMNAVADTTFDFLYLLKRGVYPFNQNHFKTGSVIDSKTIKQ